LLGRWGHLILTAAGVLRVDKDGKIAGGFRICCMYLYRLRIGPLLVLFAVMICVFR
jgi:hypothetical protein